MPIHEALRLPLTIAVGVDAGIVVPIATLLLVQPYLRGRSIARWRVVLAASALGFLLGSGVLIADANPLVRTGLVVIVVIVAASLVIAGRVGDAGAWVVAAGIPWVVYSGSAGADLALGGPVDGLRIVPPLLVAGAAVVFGAWLIVIDRREPAKPPSDEPSVASARGFGALAREVFGTGDWTNPPVVAGAVTLLATAWVTALLVHGAPVWVAWLGFAGGSVVGAGLAGLAIAFARSAPARRALEAYAWLSEGEYDRLSALGGRTVTPTMGSLRRFVREVPDRPDNRWIRVEVLAADGKLTEAREMAERMPQATAFEQLEREADLAWLDWIEGRDDDTRLRAAASAIDPADDVLRARARVVLAIHDARVRIAHASPDPLEPLRDARAALGARANRTLLRVSARLARGILPVSALLEGVVLLLDRVGAG